MPRKPRLENPGGFFHVAARAVDNATLFPATDDRHDFISLLYQTLAGFEWRCQSYCLMGTHVHLLVQPLTATLSRGMQALCSKHAMRVNRRYGRRGHLFGTRFMSVPIETDGHLLEAHRYIARNPVAAGLCDRPAAWRWSSYRGVVAVEPAFDFLDVDGLLRLFDDRPAIARDIFRRYVEDPRDQPRLYKLAEADGV
jgi:REP-associated tyrosine transposase